MNNPASELLPCPFCGRQDAYIEQLDNDSSVVICCGRLDEHTACLARGPVGLMENDFEAQPGRAAAVREWNRRAQHALPAYTEYTTQPGDSLAGIAARQLGDQERWIEIRDLNALHHPDIGPHDYYPVGTKLRMPAKQ